MAKILIADDNAAVLLLLQEIVTEAGHEVIAASKNGTDALQNYYKHIPDITILDNSMPFLDGIDVARLILDRHEKANIILCTADYERLQDTARDLGLTLIAKPFGPNQLLDHIRLMMVNGEEEYSNESYKTG